MSEILAWIMSMSFSALPFSVTVSSNFWNASCISTKILYTSL